MVMNEVIAVFNKLGADITIFYQFGIFFIFYMILKMVFFNKLQFILEIRDNKTIKLKDHADKKFEKARKLEEEYLLKMRYVQTQAYKDLCQNKEVILREQKAILGKAREDVERNVQKKIQKFQRDSDVKQSHVLSHVKEFSNKLVKRIGKRV